VLTFEVTREVAGLSTNDGITTLEHLLQSGQIAKTNGEP
jgi:hypothetical protein